jgi:glycosyl transferase, putative
MTGLEKVIKIDVISVPFSGHLFPTLTLVKPLLEDPRFQIRVITGFQKKALVEQIGFDCLALFPDRPTVMEDIANTAKQANLLIMYQQLMDNSRLVPEVFDEINRIWEAEGRPDLVIADFVAAPAGMLADRLGIPWITTIPSPVAIESRTTTPAYLGGWKPHQGIFYKWRDALGRKVIRLAKKVGLALVKKNLDSLANFKLYRKDGTEAIYSPYSILALGMKELEFRDDFPSQLKWVGYRCLSFNRLPQEQKQYFTSSNKRVFVTCGTHLKWEKERMVEYVKLLSQEYPDYVFYVTLGDPSGLEHPPSMLSENLLIFDYLPYSDVLDQMDFAIHHAGAGIMMGCIDLGIPSLILPQDYDQFDNAVRAELFQIGLVSRKKTESEVLRLFNELVSREDWSQLKALAQTSKTYQPTEILYQEIERLLKVRL